MSASTKFLMMILMAALMTMGCEVLDDEDATDGMSMPDTSGGTTATGGAATGGATTGGAAMGGAATGGAATGGAATGGAATGGAATGGVATGGAATGGMTGTGGGMMPMTGWTQVSQPCSGSRVNALWFEDANQGFIGCGENANGFGLFPSNDGGMTWDVSERDFEQIRVSNIRRGDDGGFYGAGRSGIDDFAGFTIDDSGSRLRVTGIYAPSNSGGVNDGENIAVTADGQVMIDSLTGTTFAYRAAGSDTFEEFSYLNEEIIDDPGAFSAITIRRLVTHNNKFYGVGSTINDPGEVYLPSTNPNATVPHFTRLALQPSTRKGELRDLYLWSESEMLVVGFDQSTRDPLVFRCSGDCYDTASWSQIELFDQGIEYKGDIWDIHVVGDTVVAAGEKVPTADGGFVLISRDRGLTWEDITPTPERGGVGALSAVWLFEDGGIFAGGGGGEGWILAGE